MTYAELIRRLRPFGVEFRRQARGSHEIWWRADTRQYTVIPNHAGREIAPNTLAKILRNLGLTMEDLERRA
jgi:predicted RNA binding protein YcfA (HicA-like mRNA interferase family)